MLILYVEDNFENKLFVRRVIESMGHEMIEAETGLDSLMIATERMHSRDGWFGNNRQI
jgi:CheY-like chemotaxis protein